MDEQDRALFRQAMQGVRPLATPERVTPARRRVVARARFTRAERAAVVNERIVGLQARPDEADERLVGGCGGLGDDCDPHADDAATTVTSAAARTIGCRFIGTP